MSPGVACGPHIAPSSTAARISAPVFIRCIASRSGSGSACPTAARSIACPPAMPATPDARASFAHARSGIAHRRRAEHAERRRLQRVAGEQRHRLAERDVRRGTPAAQRVVVHAGQVVVDQRIGVDHLDRCRHRVDHRDVGVRELAGRVGKERPHPLAAAQHGIAHRLGERRGRAGRPTATRRRARARCAAAARATTPPSRGRHASPVPGSKGFSTPFSRISTCCCASFSASWQ